MAQLLVESGADLEAVDDEGRTALDISGHHEHHEGNLK